MRFIWNKFAVCSSVPEQNISVSNLALKQRTEDNFFRMLLFSFFYSTHWADNFPNNLK